MNLNKDSLALLSFICLGLPFVSRAAARTGDEVLVEWGEIPYICPSVVHLVLLAGLEAWLAGPKAGWP